MKIDVQYKSNFFGFTIDDDELKDLKHPTIFDSEKMDELLKRTQRKKELSEIIGSLIVDKIIEKNEFMEICDQQNSRDRSDTA